MLSRLLAVLTWFSIVVALGQVAPGENLVLNGEFEADQVDFPHYWFIKNPKHVFYHASGGPGGRGYITLRAKEGEDGEITVRQLGLKLVAGEKYKISAWVKTKDFASKHYGVTVHNSNWEREVGLTAFPENSEWQFLESTFTMLDSKVDYEYGIAIFGVDMRGEFSFTDIRLEALTAAAQQGSRPSGAKRAQEAPRLVPWKPLLNKIPLNDPHLEMHFFGCIPNGNIADCDFVYAVNGGAAVRKPLAETVNTVDLTGLPPGDHELAVSMVRRDSGAALFTDKHVITLIQPPVIDTSGHRRLNNLVTELLHQPVATTDEQHLAFSNPRDGWVYVACQGEAATPGLQIVLNGSDIAVTAETDRREAFRLLPAGTHQLAVKGAAGAQIIVRAVPILYNYPPCTNNSLPENPPYDWDWQRKHLFLGVNTLKGRIPKKHWGEIQERGLLWLDNVVLTKLKDAEDLVGRLRKSPGLTEPQYDGVTCDELFFGTPAVMLYTDGLRQFDNPLNRLIYTYVVGKPSQPGAHHAFMSTCLNASRGQGMLLYEAYCRALPTEAEAMAYLQDFVVDTIHKFNAYFPGAVAGTMFVFGNFNQIPILSLDHEPEVDSKYYLDMQLHLIANDPAFAGLGGTGYWGNYVADEEYYRWSFRLLRHYGVEGRTDMLSEQHGFTYRPGHLQNCDFKEGLQGWTVAPASEGTVRTEKLANFGKTSQGRWGGVPGIGDTVCVLTRQNGPANSVSQKASGLQAGRLYTLQFIVADYQDAVAKRINPRRFGLNAVLSEGAEVLPEKSYVHVDKRIKGRYRHNDNVARVNLHHITFRARLPEVTITFQDSDAAPGEELAFNYVMLKPYFE
jgi:hypothetical protein